MVKCATTASTPIELPQHVWPDPDSARKSRNETVHHDSNICRLPCRDFPRNSGWPAPPWKQLRSLAEQLVQVVNSNIGYCEEFEDMSYHMSHDQDRWLVACHEGRRSCNWLIRIDGQTWGACITLHMTTQFMDSSITSY